MDDHVPDEAVRFKITQSITAPEDATFSATVKTDPSV
jgi:hypothetical protein